MRPLLLLGVLGLWWLAVGGTEKGIWVRKGAPLECIPETSSMATKTFTTLITCASISDRHKAHSYTTEGELCRMQGLGVAESTPMVSTWEELPHTITERAQGAPTFATTPFVYNGQTFTSDRAVDGNNETEYHSHYDYSAPWWLVDLGQMVRVHHVRLYPRQMAEYANRIKSIEVRLGNTLVTSGDLTSYQLFSTYPGPYTLDQGYLSCRSAEGMVGRYLSIQRALPEKETFDLSDVQVYADPI